MILKFAAAAAMSIVLAGAAWAQASPEELALQREMVQWTFWMVITSALSATFGAVSVYALVWTFIEQRRMTRDQEAAHLAVLGGSLRADGYPFLLIALRNTGRTRAVAVQIEAVVVNSSKDSEGRPRGNDHRALALIYRRRRKRPTFPEKFPLAVSFGTPGTDEIVAGSAVEMHCNARPGDYKILTRLHERADHVMWKVAGVVFYRDIYGIEREMEFSCSVALDTGEELIPLQFDHPSPYAGP